MTSLERVGPYVVGALSSVPAFPAPMHSARNFTQPQLLDEQQTVSVGPVFGDLAVDDAQSVRARGMRFLVVRARMLGPLPG